MSAPCGNLNGGLSHDSLQGECLFGQATYKRILPMLVDILLLGGGHLTRIRWESQFNQTTAVYIRWVKNQMDLAHQIHREGEHDIGSTTWLACMVPAMFDTLEVGGVFSRPRDWSSCRSPQLQTPETMLYTSNPLHPYTLLPPSHLFAITRGGTVPTKSIQSLWMTCYQKRQWRNAGLQAV